MQRSKSLRHSIFPVVVPLNRISPFPGRSRDFTLLDNIIICGRVVGSLGVVLPVSSITGYSVGENQENNSNEVLFLFDKYFESSGNGKEPTMNSQNDPQCPKVLIIEDDPGHQRLLEKLIEKSGCSCDCAATGISGIEKASSNDYDLIFVDIHIPNLDGFVVVTTLREQGFTTPMIAVTALLLDGIDRIALDAGYNDFLRKPIDQQDVSRIIDEYLNNIAKPGL